jgi:Ran GTPase-activating protein (RanGAP) involved in mRNA processing and transport
MIWLSLGGILILSKRRWLMSHISKILTVSIGYLSILGSQTTEVDTSPHSQHYPQSQGFSQPHKTTVLIREESNVKKIDFSDSQLKESELQDALKEHGHSAKQLDISNNIFDDRALKVISQYPQLQNIYLNDNCFTDRGAVSLEVFKSARKVDLSKNHITSIGISYLPLDYLEILQVKFLVLGNEGLLKISDAPKLYHLNICGADLDDNAVDILSKMKTLKKLDISYNRFSQEGVARLRKQMPETKILAVYMLE